jgi:hypothetical protein
MVSCAEKSLIAAAMVFGGLTFLLPSALTIYVYVTKWIPEEPDPTRQLQMKLVLAGSALAGVAITGAGIYYLKREKCV